MRRATQVETAADAVCVRVMTIRPMLLRSTIAAMLFAACCLGAKGYSDSRPIAELRIGARDQGVVLKHGGGPGECDALGARDVWVFQAGGKYLMHYDGAGPKGWLACLAMSEDLVNWAKKGPVLELGAKGE